MKQLYSGQEIRSLPEGWSNPALNTLRFERGLTEASEGENRHHRQTIEITVSSSGLHIETDDCDAQYTHGSFTIADIPADVMLLAVEMLMLKPNSINKSDFKALREEVRRLRVQADRQLVISIFLTLAGVVSGIGALL